MSQISGFTAFSIYAPATGTVVQVGEAQMSDEAQFTKEEVEPDRTDPSGAHDYAAHHCLFEAEIWSFAGADQLKAWAEDGTPVCVVAAGTERNLQWYEPARLHFTATPVVGAHGETNRLGLRLERKQAHPRIWAQVNLLAHLGWTDDDGDNVADGYLLHNASDPVFSDGEQRLQSSGSGRLQTEIVFPVAQSDLTLSVLPLQDPDDHLQVQLKSFTYDGAHVSLAYHDIQAADLGHRQAAENSGSGSVYKFKVFPLFGSGTVSNPSLRTDGRSDYVPY
jgi:hypothetical protein